MKQGKTEQSPKARSGLEGISKVSVCGYKSLISEQAIEIRPLTILAGANSSGKTSIMQPLLLLKQTLEASYDPGALLLDGPYVRFTSADQLLSRQQGKSCSGIFAVEIQIDDGSQIRLTFKNDPGKGFRIESLVYTHNGSGPHTLHEGMSEDEIAALLPAHFRELRRVYEKGDKRTARWVVVRDRCLLYVGLQISPDAEAVYPHATPVGPLPAYVVRTIHVPGLRANPERTYKTTAVSGQFPGTFDNYVASVINRWQAERNTTDLKSLGRAMEDLGLTWKVEARQVDDTQVELRVGRLPHSKRGGAQDLVSIADVGFGVSQALPVVVALLVAKPGNLLYIEQPEIHLHPRAQSAMARLLVEAAKRGVRVVAETHSSLLLRAVQTLAAKSEVSPKIVKLHWFTRDPDNGATVVSSADLDENGAFGDWPADFDNVELDVEGGYLDAVESRSTVR
jgi:predicted ATPase